MRPFETKYVLWGQPQFLNHSLWPLSESRNLVEEFVRKFDIVRHVLGKSAIHLNVELNFVDGWQFTLCENLHH